MGGLKNRFPKEVRYEWEDEHHCIVCGKNGWDALHHIISPAMDVYVKGEHNRSIYNSCPVHNFSCHLEKGDLSNPKVISELLVKVFKHLDAMNYEPKIIDYKFVDVYKELYRQKK
jgi:hypothetical protein